MNNAKMWLVVSPSVGVPVFLGAVAVGSFAVHLSVLSSTSWVGDFLKGQDMGSGSESAAIQLDQKVTPAAVVTERADGAQEVLIEMPDGTVARALLLPEQKLAYASGSPPLE